MAVTVRSVVMAKRSAKAKPLTDRQRIAAVAAMMEDLTGDNDWASVDPKELAKWLDLGPDYEPTKLTTRQHCEELLEQSIEPKHVEPARFGDDQ